MPSVRPANGILYLAHHSRDHMTPDTLNTSGLFRDDGSVAMCLRDVLTVWYLAIDYHDTEWIYYHALSGATIEIVPRTPGASPFDALRRNGLLDPANLSQQIAAYNEHRPVKERINETFRPYRRTPEEIQESYKEGRPLKVNRPMGSKVRAIKIITLALD